MKRIIFRLLVFALLIINSGILLAIEDFTPGDPLSAEAVRNFNEGNYEASLRFFEQLLEKYPSDGEYRYYAGRCLLALNKNPEKAADYLKVASIRNVPVDVYFYLGRAYHLSCSFKEAVSYYEKFKEFGKNREVRQLNVNRYIDQAKNASAIVRYGKVLNIKSYTDVDKALAFYQFGFNGIGGKFIAVSKLITDEFSLYADENTVVFFPDDLKKGDYVFFAARKKFSKQKDIFRMKLLDDGRWSAPEILSNVVNTPENEEYPFFDYRTSVLYFASGGHFGMGGLDLFSCKFNENTNEWSAPENLDFPVNSAGDDLMYITAGNGKLAWLISARSSAPGKAVIYEIDNSGLEIQKGYEYPEYIYKTSKLGYAPGNENSPVKPAGSRERTTVEKVSGNKVEADENYMQLINNALRLQLRADSFLRVAQDMRYAAAKIMDDETRFRVQKEIMINEKQAGHFQQLADDNYKQARDIEQKLMKEKKGDSLNQQIKEQFSSRIRPGSGPAHGPDSGSTFSIYDNSPYNEQHPFPVNISLPHGVVYRLQLGVFNQQQKWDAFGGIYPVSAEPLAGRDLTKYYAGIFRNWEDAQQALLKVRNYGFKDAFIVAYYEAKKISNNRARDLENYQGSQ